jgi:hypothetical protein
MKRKMIFSAILLVMFIANAAQATIVGGLTRQQIAAAGQTYSDSILIRNDVNEPQEYKLYQTDYVFNFKGENHYSQPAGQHPRSNADWIELSQHQVIVAPGQEVKINYTANVPNEPNLVGTYWSMIMIEAIPTTSPESSLAKEVPETQLSLRQVVRYGIQMITHIGDTGQRQLKFLDTKVVKDSEKRELQVDIENTGQRWLRPFLWAELYDNSGNYVGRFEAQKRRIYPTTSVRYRVDLTDLADGQYNALVVADSGDDNIFGANYSLKLGQ